MPGDRPGRRGVREISASDVQYELPRQGAGLRPDIRESLVGDAE